MFKEGFAQMNYCWEKVRKTTMKTVLMFLCTVFVLQMYCLVESHADFDSVAPTAVLMEASTGKIIYEKNADEAMPPASITKIMTLFLAFDAIEEGRATWEDEVPISVKAWKMQGSKMFLEAGKKIKYIDLVTGISVVSANDGCVALAEYLYGTEEAFVKKMNEKAAQLGLSKTHFENCTGLPAEGHKMSARDIAVLARHLISTYPQILEIESKTEFTYNNIKQRNRNPLLGTYPGADGLKTGWTEEAGYCLVGTAEQNGMRLISVVLNTKNEKERLFASQQLLNYGFKNFEFVKLKSAGEIVDSIKVKDGKLREVELKTDRDITALVKSSDKNKVKFEVKKDHEYLKAPVKEGTPVGKIEALLDGEAIASADVLTTEDVARVGLLTRFIRWFFGLFSK